MTRVYCLLLSLVLLNLLTEITAPKSIRNLLTRRKSTNKGLNKISPSSPSRSSSSRSSRSPDRASQSSGPDPAELAQIREIFIYDAKTAKFVQKGSPSFKQAIINLSQKTAPVEGMITTAVKQEAKNAVVTNYVPMSRSVVEQMLKLSDAKIAEVERRTEKYRSELYDEKRYRITADLFSYICLNPAKEAYAAWLASPVPRPDFWREVKVLNGLRDDMKLQNMKPCGLFVDRSRGYLAAEPDALVGDNGIVKLKVIQRPTKETQEYKWVVSKKELSRDDPLYYEVQGLLAITGKDICHLVIVTRQAMTYYQVNRDEEFWKNEMLDKIENFYMDVIHPKLSNEELPNIKNIRIGASVLYLVTMEKCNPRQILARTQGDDYDTLVLESRTRLLSRHFFLIMDTKLSMKEKLMKMLLGRFKDKEHFEEERSFRMAYVNSYAEKNKYQVSQAGLIIDRTTHYLGALPSAIGRSKVVKTATNSWVTRTFSKIPSISSNGNGKSNGGKSLKSRLSNKWNSMLGKSQSTVDPKDVPPVSPEIKPPPTPATPAMNPAVVFEVIEPAKWWEGDVIRKPEDYHLSELPYMEKTKGGKGLGKNKDYTLKKDSQHYYKIQGSLAIRRAQTCIFLLAIPGGTDSVVQMVEFDPTFWANMLEKIKHFYFSTFLIYLASPAEYHKIYPEVLPGWPKHLDG